MDEMQIVGADGRVYVGDDAEALYLVSGYEEGTISGDEIIGAAPRFSRSRLSPAVRSRLTRAIATARPAAGLALSPANFGAPRVVPAAPGPLREVVQGLFNASVAAGAAVDIQFNATMLFRPSRLMVGPNFAAFFTINDIRVGADSLFLSAGPVPGEAFLPDAVTASALKRRSASPGTPVIVTVQNVDGFAHPFRGAIFGEASDTSQCST